MSRGGGTLVCKAFFHKPPPISVVFSLRMWDWKSELRASWKLNKNLIRKIKNETFQNEKWYTISRQQTKSLNKNETDNPKRKIKI